MVDSDCLTDPQSSFEESLTHGLLLSYHCISVRKILVTCRYSVCTPICKHSGLFCWPKSVLMLIMYRIERFYPLIFVLFLQLFGNKDFFCQKNRVQIINYYSK